MLAEIWHVRGEKQSAQDLLVDCLRRLLQEIKDSQYPSDRQTFADEFRHHRATFTRLFPGGEAELNRLGIPVDPFQP